MRGRPALGRQLTALAVVPPACAALLGVAAVIVLVHSSHRSQPFQGKTLFAISVVAVLLIAVVVAGFVWAGRVARSASAAVEIVRVPVPFPAAASFQPQPSSASSASGAPTMVMTSAPAAPVAADRGVFVHLSHRLQSLVHRQIQLLDSLENDVEEPDLLKGLFGVDHLATRMRRHAENLAVLGGAVPRRQWTKPVSVMEVLRSAVSETLDYARVQVIARAPGSVNGYAVADVIHLLAELVENATTFSPPDTKVVLRTQAVAAGLVIEIDDRGLGMSQPEYDRLNALLREPAEISVRELLEGARIGLYVVAQLARRHQVAVKLQTNITGGTQALVVLPKTLLANDPRELAAPASSPEPAAAPAVPGPAPVQVPIPAQAPPPAPAPMPIPPSPAPALQAGEPHHRIEQHHLVEPHHRIEQHHRIETALPPVVVNGIDDFHDAPTPTTRPVYGIDGALPAPRRAPNPAGGIGQPPLQNRPVPPGPGAQGHGYGPPPGTHPLDQGPMPGASGYALPGAAASPSPDPRSRPPLPRRRPQEHLAAPLTQTAFDPAERVGEGLTPNLMADFRRGLALGATEPQPGGQPHENSPNHQEGRR